ncbi:MAG: DUF4168 domain-containing protein [Geminicoccaceae bacterium]
MTRTLVLRVAVGALFVLSAIGLSVQLSSADVEIEDQKLRAFIKAALTVDSVMDKWQPKIIKARDSNETEMLHVRANAEIREAIESADGISFDEYQKIRNAIAADPDMLDRVTNLMWEQQGK